MRYMTNSVVNIYLFPISDNDGEVGMAEYEQLVFTEMGTLLLEPL